MAFSSPFGSTAPSFGSTAPGFGQSSFGQPTGAGFGQTAASPFGAATPTSGFGAAPAMSPFGGGAAAAPAFGASNTFGSTANKPLFGSTTSTAPAFGAGASGAFGSTAGASPFGSNTGSTFGATATSNPFGATTQTTAASPFGAPAASNPFGAPTTGSTFGGTNTFGASTTSPFGSTAPASGGLFGSSTTPTAGSTSAFGSSAPSPFGAPAASASPFGAPAATNSSPFGSATQTASPFGASTSFGAFGSTTAGFGGTTTGTGNPAYRDTPDTDAQPPNSHKFQSISAMSEYNKKSFEELRWEDYQRGNKGNAAASAGGPTLGMAGSSTNPFGASTTPSAFGNSSSGSMFGGAATSSPFGSTTTASPFGVASAPATNTFGGNTSLFGASPSPATNNPFGSTSTGAFGSTSLGGTTTTSAFGSTPPTSSFSFGSTAPSSSFGSSAPAASSAFGGFGSTPAASTPSPFGTTAPSTGMFGGSTTATSSPFSFGGQTMPSSTSASGSLFGNTSATSSFGAGSAFGSSAPSTGGLFGSTTPNTGGGLFGSTTTPAQPFGSTSGSLFGSTTNTAQPAAGSTGSLFGSTPSSFGNFGANLGANTPSTSLFNTSNTGSSLFGGFGTPTQPIGGALAPAQPQQLVASHKDNPYGMGNAGAGLVEQQVKAALALPLTASSSGKSIGIGVPGPSPTSVSSVDGGSALTITAMYRTPRGVPRIRPRGLATMNNGTPLRSKGPLFDSGTDMYALSPDIFVNRNTKRLVIENADDSQMGNGLRLKTGENVASKPLLALPSSEGESRKGAAFNSLDKGGDRTFILAHFMGDGSVSRIDIDSSMTVAALKKKLVSQKDNVQEDQLLLLVNGRALSDDVQRLVDVMNETNKMDVAIQSIPPSRQQQTSPAKPLALTASTNQDHQTPDKATSSVLRPTPMRAAGTPTGQNGVSTPLPSSRFSTYDSVHSREKSPRKTFSKQEPLSPDVSVSPLSRPKQVSPARGRLNQKAPILDREGYYTYPALAELERMTDAELSSVSDFTIGRPGCGSIKWIGQVDVRGLRLDDIVDVGKREVIVYRDETSKPPEGSELNRPAIIELEGIFPMDDSEESRKKYQERVERRTKKQGATLISYNPRSGIWKFRTEHFSRYGLDDSDSEDEGSTASGQKLLKLKENDTPQSAKKSLRVSRSGVAQEKGKLNLSAPSFEEDSSENSSDDDDMVTDDSSADEKTKTTQSLPQQIGLDPHRLQNLKSSFFARNNQEDYQSNITSTPIASFSPILRGFASNARMQTQAHGISAAPSFNSTPVGLVKPRLPPPQVYASSLCATSAISSIASLSGESQSTAKPESESLCFKIAAEAGPTLNARSTRPHSRTDMAMFLGRSFRCSFGPNGELVHPGKLLSSGLSSNDLKTLNCASVVIEYPLQRIARPGLEKELEVHLSATSAVSTREDEMADEGFSRPSHWSPLFRLPPLEQLVSCFHSYVRVTGESAQGIAQLRHSCLVWKLVNALWGQERARYEDNIVKAAIESDHPEDDTSNIVPYDIRREAISTWLREAVSNLAPPLVSRSSEVSDDQVLDEVFESLCFHEIERAAETAFLSGYPRLAILLTQIQVFYDDESKADIEAQIAMWNTNKCDKLIDPKVMRLFLLLTGSLEDVDMSTLHWLQALGCLLWYRYGPGERVFNALSAYNFAFETEKVKPPTTLYKGRPTDEYATPAYDLLYHLLQLYCNHSHSLRTLLAPRTSTADDLDYHMSWHMASILEVCNDSISRDIWELNMVATLGDHSAAIGFPIETEVKSAITWSYIQQLEAAGLWQWAVYVALTNPSPSSREFLTKELLLRHTPSWEHQQSSDYTSKMDFLTKRLGISEKWISEAKAIRAKYDRNVSFEISQLIACENWAEAHYICCRKLAPTCIFQGDYVVLGKIIQEISHGADSHSIPEWDTHGKLYLDYLSIVTEKVEELTDPNELRAVLVDQVDKIMEISSRLRTWQPLPGWSSEEDKWQERVCIASISCALSEKALLLNMRITELDEQLVEVDTEQEIPQVLRPDFLHQISLVTKGDAFGERLNSHHFDELCSSFVAWRMQSVA